MPCPFTGPKMFCAVPNFLSQRKNLTAFSASSKTFLPVQKLTLLNANNFFVWHKMFVTATICKEIFGVAQKIWSSPKFFGTWLTNLESNSQNSADYEKNTFITLFLKGAMILSKKLFVEDKDWHLWSIQKQLHIFPCQSCGQYYSFSCCSCWVWIQNLPCWKQF